MANFPLVGVLDLLGCSRDHALYKLTFKESVKLVLMIVFTHRRPLEIPPIGTPSFAELSHSMCHLRNVLQLVGVHVGTMMDS